MHYGNGSSRCLNLLPAWANNSCSDVNTTDFLSVLLDRSVTRFSQSRPSLRSPYLALVESGVTSLILEQSWHAYTFSNV